MRTSVGFHRQLHLHQMGMRRAFGVDGEGADAFGQDFTRSALLLGSQSIAGVEGDAIHKLAVRPTKAVVWIRAVGVEGVFDAAVVVDTSARYGSGGADGDVTMIGVDESYRDEMIRVRGDQGAGNSDSRRERSIVLEAVD